MDINQESNAAQIGSNVILADPAFVDTTKEDFNLSIASILIGRGTSLFEGESAPLSDITGSQRPNPSGTNPDIGAYENSLGNLHILIRQLD